MKFNYVKKFNYIKESEHFLDNLDNLDDFQSIFQITEELIVFLYKFNGFFGNKFSKFSY